MIDRLAPALLLLAWAAPAEARTLALGDAIKDPALDVRLESVAQSTRVLVSVRNRGNDAVLVVADLGTRLAIDNEDEQDVVLGEKIALGVASGAQESREVLGYCTRPNRRAPSAGRRYAPIRVDAELASAIERAGRSAGATAAALQERLLVQGGRQLPEELLRAVRRNASYALFHEVQCAIWNGQVARGEERSIPAAWGCGQPDRAGPNR